MRPIIPNRKIEGISAILLPFDDEGKIDHSGFLHHLKQTLEAGLIPAVNMDTGYANLISAEERTKVLRLTRDVCDGKPYVAGAYIEDLAGEPRANYKKAVVEIQVFNGTPIIFQSTALTTLPDEEIVEVYKAISTVCDKMLAFELGAMFAPFGRIYTLEVVEELMRIPQITGMKHSSLKREPEWQRLELRNRIRPDFKIFTGNDLAIDMVMYGSDYLLGLSTFAPDFFALRDKYWLEGDGRFYELNDVLQYLGQFAFRSPTSAYKHSAAQFLKLRGWIGSDKPHPEGQNRPDTDVEILQKILIQLKSLR